MSNCGLVVRGEYNNAFMEAAMPEDTQVKQRMFCFSSYDLAVMQDVLGRILDASRYNPEALNSWHAKHVAGAVSGISDLLWKVQHALVVGLNIVLFSNIELVYIHASLHHMVTCESAEWQAHETVLTYTRADQQKVIERISLYLESDKPLSFSAYDLAVLYETIDCITKSDLDGISDWSEGTYGSLKDEVAMLTRISRLLRGDSKTAFTHFDLSYFDAALQYVINMEENENTESFMSYGATERGELSDKIARYLRSQEVS